MKIVHLAPPMEKRVGGIDAFLQDLDRELRGAGCVSEMLECVGSAGKLPEADVYHFHGLWQPAALNYRRAIANYARPYVLSPHGMLEPWAWRHRWWKKIPYFILREFFLLRRASRLLATSEMEKQSIDAWVSGPPIDVLPIGISHVKVPAREESRQIVGLQAEDKILLFLSRLHRKKGLKELLLALAEESSALKQWRLVIVGDGEPGYVDSLKRLAHDLQPRLLPVTWTGPKWGPEKWSYFAAADCYCLPSFSENFGISVLEALVCDTPVITTSATPWQELETWPGCAIIPPGIDGLRSLLRGLDQQLHERRPGLLREKALEKYGWDKLAADYIQFYQRAASR